MPDRRDNTAILKVIENTIKVTVNGKIDKIHQEVLGIKTTQDEMKKVVDDLNVKVGELAPVNTGIATIKNIKNGLTFTAGFLTPFAIIGGALLAIFKVFLFFSK